MTSNADNPPTATPKSKSDSTFWWSVIIAASIWSVMTLTGNEPWDWLQRRSPLDPEWGGYTPAPLVMKGGDPYIRALMRTISASESNGPRPYSLLYGGEHFYDFSQHPDRCVTIVAGPNVGDCTTAAGRYQMLTTTWIHQAKLYHPEQSFLFFWQDYSFEPEYQDEVVYRWLSDPSVWGVDLVQLLHEGEVEEVLQILSPTWTSLGYGIETNSMSGFLPEIYEEMLQEELKEAG